MPVVINAPGTSSFEPAVNLKDIMGTWYVTHSTLPMWKSKKDVTITYTPLDPAKPDGAVTRFDDVVEYYSLSSPASHKRTRIAGVDTLTDPPTLFKWCGSGLLTPITSRWQLLGVDAAGQEWAVTFFESTLFSPAGIDVYERGPGGAAEDVLREIKEGLREVCGEAAKLAEQLFEVQQECGGQSW